MDDPSPLSHPERTLAIAYAPAERRAGLRALFALDERLGAIVAAAGEPGIAAIKLAWWRDALVRLDEAHPPAEPLLQAIAREVLPHGVSGSALADMETGWLAVLEEAGAEAESLHARDRGGRLFTIAATILGGSDPRLGAAGAGWALVERACTARSDAARTTMLASARAAFAGIGRSRWPVRLRALGMLATLARRDAARGTIGQPGSPGRVLRALVHRATGV